MNLEQLHRRQPLVLPLALGVIAVALGLLARSALAADGATGDPDWLMMTVELLGGLAIFLYGMLQMEEGLKAVAGERMKGILARLTVNRFMGVGTGALVTAVIQSSSVTTVLVVGFISAGLMSLSQSVGVIMGANIGTTITAQIVAFKITKAALGMIAVGFAMLFIAKNERTKHYGEMLMGLGMVFFGMHVMSEAMEPLRSYQPFLDLMKTMDNPIVGVLIATAFTALIQSSSASTGIVIVMASQGFISLQAGIALAFGANIGTCATALLAVIGKPREAVRAAIVHLLFNVCGVLIWLPFIGFIASLVTSISPSYPDLDGAARLAAETPRQIANAHTFFNIANTLIFIWFTTQIARLVEWLVPDRALEEEALIVRTRFLQEELLGTPSLALDQVRMEVMHMGETVNTMMQRIMPAIIKGDREALEEIRQMDDTVDILHAGIIDYLGRISKQQLSDEQTRELLQLMEAVSNLENIGDIIETNLVVLGYDRIKGGIQISEATQGVLNGFQQAITRAVTAAVQAVAQRNQRAAQVVTGMKEEINEIADSAALHEARRLVAEEPNRIPAYTMEIDIIEKQKRIYYFAKRMARTVLPTAILQRA
ncbi:Na/Pi cotransporter family protein [Accumulibacter sp.]|jgi:phosphate:Na+ symporter|uniref:Na/Pi cotransporter family protein n=1 Tax=Accumulibacter sp. TaxID=2053492 RepID=UPI001ACAD26F|nr:Na/Pi cotransporter family protein [Accumulibacter sp.]MBN8452008.1 Na/Pi cotransporter family protein [Accumulibacter sp.]MBO3711937.1 Na/Pi cotransporter family protein [Accumulibacter sp.]